MNVYDAEFLESLRATFRAEAAEHLQVIAAGLLQLEKSPAPDVQRGLVETVFRAAHNLKGAARAVDFTDIESQCQSLEDVFAAWKRGHSAPSPETLDGLHRRLNSIAAALSATQPASAARDPAEQPPPSQSPATAAAPPEDSVRISIAKLDARLMQAEEMLTAKLITARRLEELRDLWRRFDVWQKEWSAVEPEARALREAVDRPADHGRGPDLRRLRSFLDWNVDYVRSLESSVSTLKRSAEQNHHVVGKLVDDLMEDSKKLLLLPFATLAAQFPKLARDISREQGKEAVLEIRGEDIEIDKRILEEMKDALVHLLRNCVDHGIEPPAERVRLGKPARATITLAVSQLNGSKVEILVSDDGAGIDVEKVKASAVKRGVLSEADARQLGNADAEALVFQPEVSTSPVITKLSGRGLGLAIVREKAEKLSGTVSLESRPGQGTAFRIVLPSLLATFRGILVETGERVFVVPTAHVEYVARVSTEIVKTVEGRETIALNGRIMSFTRLHDVLELPRTQTAAVSASKVAVVVLGSGEQRIAFAVDAVLGEQEVLVKRLSRPLSRVRNIAGVTVLGSGQLVPILNVADLLKSARAAGRAVQAAAAPPKPVESRSILVVDDSITSRMLIKSMLESAGYKVKTAVDGIDAFTILRSEHFDLVVSDVEMPRLNGFDLTARIRADKKLADLPVVLVTAMEAPEDRERGIDVGANAYIIKSSLDQGNLRDAIRRLV